MSDATQVLECIASRLKTGPFKVSRGVALQDGHTADIAGSRTYVSWKGLVILSQHVVVRHIDNATEQDMKALFESGFRFGKKANWVPLLRGIQFGYMIIPVIVGDNPHCTLVENVAKCPSKHWSLFEFPVVVDLGARRIVYFEGTASWGAFFFSDLRRVAENFIKGSLFNQGNQ